VKTDQTAKRLFHCRSCGLGIRKWSSDYHHVKWRRYKPALSKRKLRRRR
jgi:hypothetical protein